MPTRNRFPESAVEDDDTGDMDSSGSEPDYAAISEAEAAPYASGNEMEGEDSASNAGDSIGGNASLAVARNAWALRDPALRRDRPGLDMDLSPSAAMGWSANAPPRPGKRKMNDNERFEPYNSAFKRRAVSPAASTSSVSLSPLLTNTALKELPSAAGLPALGPPVGIPIGQGSAQSSVPPSPAIPMAAGSWFNPSRSRASSPAPSMSSSAGTNRRWMGPVPEEDREKNKVDLGKMSLG